MAIVFMGDAPERYINQLDRRGSGGFRGFSAILESSRRGGGLESSRLL